MNPINFIEHLFNEEKSIKSIWLIGSKANDRNTKNSDLDLLIFGSDLTSGSMKLNGSYRKWCLDLNIDIIIVLPNENLYKPFGSIYEASLKSWNWKETGSKNASYTGQENIDCEDSDGGVGEIKCHKAQKLFQR